VSPAGRLGPVQLVAIGLDEDALGGAAAERLLPSLAGDVRVLDVLLVRRGDRGELEELDAQPAGCGAVVANLIGLRDEGRLAENGDPPGDVWYLDEAIPPGRPAAVVLVEHRWASGLAGRLLCDAWVQPADLEVVAPALRSL